MSERVIVQPDRERRQFKRKKQAKKNNALEQTEREEVSLWRRSPILGDRRTGWSGSNVRQELRGTNDTRRKAGCQIGWKTLYFFLRPRNTSKAPASNAIALPPEAGLISGTAATAAAEAPIPSSNRAIVFRICK